MKNKRAFIIVLLIFLTVPVMAQFGKMAAKVIAPDGYWRDYTTLKNVKLDMTMDEVQKILSEPNQVVAMYKDNKGANMTVHLYRFKEKSTKNAVGVKPQLQLLDKPVVLWSDSYILNLTYKDGKLWQVGAPSSSEQE
tara:strand:- start:152 stop:562 length:411 start_codon:yes stop_codon:yes gene_type:complete